MQHPLVPAKAGTQLRIASKQPLDSQQERVYATRFAREAAEYVRRLERDLIYKPCGGGNHFALASLTLALCRCRLPASATRLRFWRNVDATPPDSPRCWTCAGSLPGIGRASPYLAP